MKTSLPSTRLESLIELLEKKEELRKNVRYLKFFPEKPASYENSDIFKNKIIENFLKESGLYPLYSHQAKTFCLLSRGKNVVLSTPTASGKTLAYHLWSIQKVLEENKKPFHALYLYPLKALAQDQKKKIEQWNEYFKVNVGKEVHVEIYDGDTPPAQRTKIKKKPPQVLLSNPDMLHQSLLAHHDTWANFLKDLKFIVLDEAHTYRGIFGSHVALVLRRLARILDAHGAKPQFVACSATMGNPGEFLFHLTGERFEVIEETGAPLAPGYFLFWDSQDSVYTDAVRLLELCIRQNLRTIVFTKARKITELLSMWILEKHPEWRSRIRSYRAGYLPEERRKIEKQLFEGKISAIVSTSALEAGIDVGGLDVCLLVGYPGTVIATRQRAGRVGRSEEAFLVALLAQKDALDQYWLKHPEKFFMQKPEYLVVDPENPVLLKNHLTCAAAEWPLTSADQKFFGEVFQKQFSALLQEGALLEGENNQKYFSISKNPQRNVSLRDCGERYAIFEENTEKTIGTIDAYRAFREGHPGAVYLHQGETFVVQDLILSERRMIVREEDVDYYTQVNYDTETEILEKRKERVFISPAKTEIRVFFGKLKVTHRFLNYERHAWHDGRLLSTIALSLPPQSFETEGVWMVLPGVWRKKLVEKGRHFLGSLHALEHTLIALMPMRVLCDRWDLGGVSMPSHPQIPSPCIFIYDGTPGGAGLCAKAYVDLEHIVEAAGELLETCACEDGCPACVQSPKCGSGNDPLDKAGACWITEAMLGRASDMQKRGEDFLALSYGDFPKNLHKPPEPAEEKEAPWREPTGAVVLDLETQFLSSEIPGGWKNIEGMKLACAVAYDVKKEKFFSFREETVEKLIQLLCSASLVVGFNVKRFDYRVLAPYTDFNLQTLPTLDLLEKVAERLGRRISLSHLCRCTLGEDKSANGLLAVQWWRQGDHQKVEEYCKEDVRLTYALWEFGRKNGYVLFQHQPTGEKVKCPVQW